MIIRGKLGTMPQDQYRVKYKRKFPKVGDRLLVKRILQSTYAKWDSVIVDMISDDLVFMSYL